MTGKYINSEDYISRIVDLYADSVYRFAFLYLKNRHDAEVAAQEVLVKLYRKPNPQSIPPYIYYNNVKYDISSNVDRSIMQLPEGYIEVGVIPQASEEDATSIRYLGLRAGDQIYMNPDG